VETREALATALAEFSGSMLLVSHDRHLLRTTVDDFWIVADGGVREFDGDLEDYRDHLAARGAAEKSAERAAKKTGDASLAVSADVDRKTQKRQEAEERQRLSNLRKPLEKQLAQVERDMEKTRSRLAELDTLIADPDFYSGERRAQRQQALADHGELSKQAGELDERWLAIQEKLEALT
jgi:ATP-binding cassette subfamily F protein 3